MNYSEPVEIAEKVYWVGCKIPNDPFQCHVYLIENGDESILIDPGSRITYEETRKKIERVVPLDSVKYLICHHQDPDIVGCVEDLVKDSKTRKTVVTHWRAWALLKHHNWDVDLYEVEENTWRLKAGDRKLRFIFTPYLHFPGAFCSFDENSKVLFSSDLFGAMNEEFELFASDPYDYFMKLKPFHEHYMPSNIILNNGLDKIEKLREIELIAPQHGSIIRKEFVRPIIRELRKLRCGLFGEFENTREIVKLSEFNEALREIIEIIAYQEKFFNIINRVLSSLNKFYVVEYIRAYVANDNEDKIIMMDSEKGEITITDNVVSVRNMLQAAYYLKEGGVFYTDSHLLSMFSIQETSYVFSVKDKRGKHYGLCFIAFNHNNLNIPADLEIIRKFEVPLSMAILQERYLFCMESRSKQLYEESIRDPLTGLYNRHHMTLLAKRELESTNRFKRALSVVMIDVDDFKRINDTYGHYVGDAVLRNIGYLIKNCTRSIDLPVRYGGEEFLLILPNTRKENAYRVAEKIRRLIENNVIEIENMEIRCTVSAGVASTEEFKDEVHDIMRLIITADKRLYKAKTSGKNMVVAE